MRIDNLFKKSTHEKGMLLLVFKIEIAFVLIVYTKLLNLKCKNCYADCVIKIISNIIQPRLTIYWYNSQR